MSWGASYKVVYEAIRTRLTIETAHRGCRSIEQWVLAERQCVLDEVNRQRALLSRVPVEIAAVERAERTALGHSDYVSQYAHAAADLVFREEHS